MDDRDGGSGYYLGGYGKQLMHMTNGTKRYMFSIKESHRVDCF